MHRAVKLAPVGVVIAAIAALYQLVLESVPTNDDFLHLALSRQLLAGDLPIRDFFDNGLTLQFGLSAASQAIFGHRLLSEAIVIAAAFFVSAYAVFTLVRTLTGSTPAAVLAALLLLLAGPRGYSYPKIVVYAVAAALWWQYVLRPSRAGAIALGVWTAIAFYWRPDHGLYVAAGVVLAMVAAHGLRRPLVTDGALSGATTVALVLPFLALVMLTGDLGSYARGGLRFARTQHTTMDSHAVPRWPLHRVSDVLQIAPPEVFAPVVSVRWAADTPPEQRRAVLARHRIAAIEDEDERTTRVRLASADSASIKSLINDPAVDDTAGIDRPSASLTLAEWPLWDRVRFRHRWLGWRLFAGLDDQRDASEGTAALFYVLPVVAFVVLVALRHRLAVTVTVPALAAFSAFVLIVELGLLRTPYDVRAVDGVAMPAILVGCVAGLGSRFAAAGGKGRRVMSLCLVAALVVFSVKAVASSGQFLDRVGWLAGDWRSAARMRGAWSDAASRLVASPPLSYWTGPSPPVSIRLAQYANACVPASERLAVLWFAPEIYYYADRLMALRHLVFVPGLTSPEEQRLTAEKFMHSLPPVVLAPAALSTFTRTVFPDLVGSVERDYIQAGSLDEDSGYQVLVRRGRTAASTWGPGQWPCFR
jgi:hypothetical protein